MIDLHFSRLLFRVARRRQSDQGFWLNIDLPFVGLSVGARAVYSVNADQRLESGLAGTDIEQLYTQRI